MLKLFSGNNIYMLAELEPKTHKGWFENGHFYWQNSLQTQQVTSDKMLDVLSGAEKLTTHGINLLNLLREIEPDRMLAEAPFGTLEDETDYSAKLLAIVEWLTNEEKALENAK